MSTVEAGAKPTVKPPGTGALPCVREERATGWRIERIDGAQQDIYRLLEFATEHARPRIDPAMINAAVDIARVKPCAMTEEQEGRLWQTRRALSEAVRPAHAAGLRLMKLLETEASLTREPRALRRWSGRWLLVSLLVVAITHAYAEVGGRLISEANTQLTLVPSLASSAAGADTASAKTKGAARATAEANAKDLNEAIREAQRTLDDRRQRLYAWNLVWRFPGVVWPRGMARDSGTEPASMRTSSTSSEDGHRVRADARQTILDLKSETYAADVAQTTISHYVLPMLYGALGAFVFVMRGIGRDIDRGSLRMLLQMRYRIRLLLGAVFGLSVAMLTTEQSPFLKDIPLTAIALAFIAGYGIDAAFGLLDAAIDRIRRMVPKEDQTSGGDAADA